MRVSYHPDYYVPLPPGHAFPMGKFPALHRILIDEGLLRPEEVHTPGEADWEDLLLVHDHAYLYGLRDGTIDQKALRRLGLPWSPGLVRRSRLAAQGSIDAARMALEDGLAANLAGGTHHAFADHGEGFCVLNDVAIAIRVLQRDRRLRRALVIDLDVHQGNGTAACLRGDEGCFTFSMHGAKNYPWRKEQSSRDVGLPDGMGDQAYLDLLADELGPLFDQARPELVIYLAGVDVLAGDRFGRLSMTRAGLREREGMVIEAVRRAGLPLLLVLSGGYAANPDQTADLHAEVHRVAAGR